MLKLKSVPQASARKVKTPPMDLSPMIDLLNVVMELPGDQGANDELQYYVDKLVEMREAQLRSMRLHKESDKAKDPHPSIVVSPSSATTIRAPTRSSSSNHKSNHVVSSPSDTTTLAPKVQHEDLICYKCHDQGHHPLACPTNTCGKCQVQGHTFWDCPITTTTVTKEDEEQEPQGVSTLQDGGI